MKSCNFYHNLNLETVILALKMTQICCIKNYEHFFYWNWQFSHKLASPLLHPYQAWKIFLTIRENMKGSGTRKYQFSNSLVKCGKFGSKASANIQKSQYCISFVKWRKLRSPTWATFTNSSSQYFSELGKSLK